MLWVKSFHVVFMVSWFAGLFYLPRLFVYHAQTTDQISNERFKIMERRLYRGIMTPTAVLTVIFGIWLLSFGFKGYMQQGWMHAKLGLIVLLIAYHLMCGHYVKKFREDANRHSHTFYRFFNEVPLIFLIAVTVLAIVKPF